MKKLKRIILKFAYPIMKIYWFIFRPKTRGAKVIVTCNGETLLICHSYGGSNWTFPGGGIKRGEEVMLAGKRELKEELNIAVDDLVELGSFVRTEEYKLDTVFVLQTEIDDRTKNNITIDGVEIIKAKWFKLDNLPKLNKTNQKIISFLLNKNMLQ